MGALTLGLQNRPQQALSPRLQRAVRLLQLSSLDFAQEVNDALSDNPFLVADDVDGAVDEMSAASAPEYQPEAPSTPADEHDVGLGSEIDDERESWFADGDRGRRQTTDKSIIELRPAEPTLNEHLLRQIGVLPLSPRDQAIGEAIIGSLDGDGYLRAPLCELVGVANLQPTEDEDELQTALSLVQSLDPPGIAARNLRECLLLQLPALVGATQGELARRIIGEQFDALAAADVVGLAHALQCSPREIAAALVAIRRLEPRPGARFASARTPYITPDVIVRKVRGQWTATLNPTIVPKVSLHQAYADLFVRHRGARDHQLAACLQEARWTLSNVEQRFATILSVAQAIIRRQQHFLDYGALAMKPLGLHEIADELGIHESTVSRVTNNKFMATPSGVFELKYFFSRVIPTVNGGKCSATAIRSLIKEMIAGERPGEPISDPEIAGKLARQGLLVARRTITKYRQQLHIEAAERRRKHA